MMNSLRLLSRHIGHPLRRFHKCSALQENAAAAAATVAAESVPVPPVSTDIELSISPKIDKVANDIMAMNLVEVAQLSELLKKRLNLPDMPVMSMGFGGPPPPVEEEEQKPAAVQTEFSIKLVGFDEKQKIPLIKEIKNLIPDTNLVKAKKIVESLPAVIRTDISKEEVEQLKVTIEKVGGTVEIY